MPDVVAADAATRLREDEIAIVDDPLASPSEKIDLGHRFEKSSCDERRAAGTMLHALLPDARRILVHRFDSRIWPDLDAVKSYVRRVLRAEPEGGSLSPGVYWAKLRVAEILASVEFSSGQRRPLQLANGYAHFQDGAGCDWWTRYLGPDRSKRIVWP
jgi:hypothetical protein